MTSLRNFLVSVVALCVAVPPTLLARADEVIQ